MEHVLLLVLSLHAVRNPRRDLRQDKAFERRFVIVELSEPTEVTQNSGRRGGVGAARVSFGPKRYMEE